MADQENTFIIECEVKPDLVTDFDAMVPLLESVAEDDAGTVEYRWYGASSPTARCLYERYQDSDATLAHMAEFGQEPLKRWQDLVTLTSVTMIGSASEQLTAQLAPFFDGSVPGVDAAWYRSS
jgi:quinol monooxygenase YgiN